MYHREAIRAIRVIKRSERVGGGSFSAIEEGILPYGGGLSCGSIESTREDTLGF